MPRLAAADTLIMCQRTLWSALGAVEWTIPAGHALWQVAAEENDPEGTEDCLGHSLGHTPREEWTGTFCLHRGVSSVCPFVLGQSGFPRPSAFTCHHLLSVSSFS